MILTDCSIDKLAYLQAGQRDDHQFPLTGRSDSFVKNYAKYAQYIRNEMVNGDLMVTFDVVSLYNNMTVEESFQSISTLLSIDDTLEE